MANGTASSAAFDDGSRSGCSTRSLRHWLSLSNETDRPTWSIRPSSGRITALPEKKGTQDQEALGRSRGGFSTKIHARCDGKGRPLGFTITPGQAHDIKGFTTLLRTIGDKIDALLADKGYDADAVRQALSEMEVEAVIPSKSNRKQPIAFDRKAYKRRNLIERMFNKLKNWRRVATRYDKTASSFLAFIMIVIMIASAKLWVPFVHET
jgi:transposase